MRESYWIYCPFPTITDRLAWVCAWMIASTSTILVLVLFFLPNNFQDPICNNKHFPRHFPFPTDQIPRRKNICFHLEDEIVEEFGLTFLKYGHLYNQSIPQQRQVVIKSKWNQVILQALHPGFIRPRISSDNWKELTHFLQNAEVDVECELSFELVR